MFSAVEKFDIFIKPDLNNRGDLKRPDQNLKIFEGANCFCL
jgi:hypothetical protein